MNCLKHFPFSAVSGRTRTDYRYMLGVQLSPRIYSGQMVLSGINLQPLFNTVQIILVEFFFFLS